MPYIMAAVVKDKNIMLCSVFKILGHFTCYECEKNKIIFILSHEIKKREKINKKLQSSRF